MRDSWNQQVNEVMRGENKRCLKMRGSWNYRELYKKLLKIRGV